MNSAHGLGALLTVVEFAGLFVFAISGGLTAVSRRLDLFGILVLSAVTGLGGGTLRGVLIGAVPPAALSDWRYLVTTLVAGLLAFRFHPVIGRRERLINMFDAVGLGFFCVTGASKAIDYGLDPLPAALLGMVTGIGGGMMRDVLAGRIPIILRPGELYAIPALAGAGIVVVGRLLEVSTLAAAVPAVLVCTGWRLLALRRGWHAPTPRDPA